ncbi:hypothetical protein PAMP_001309 [Pampus punctatissimus]
MAPSNSNYIINNDTTCELCPQNPFPSFTLIMILIVFPLTIPAIYALFSQVRNNNVVPIYVINLLITDLIQLCSLTVYVATFSDNIYTTYNIHIYTFGVLASVSFMVCVSLERYLVIAWPLWYHFRRNIKISLVVCVVAWILPLVCVLFMYFKDDNNVSLIIFAVFFLFPFPLLIFSLGGSLKALSAAIRVPSDEKRRIVGILVLVLLIYTLLFLPSVIWILAEETRSNTFNKVTTKLLQISPLADMILYIFIRKGPMDKLFACLCCCRMDSDDNSKSST